MCARGDRRGARAHPGSGVSWRGSADSPTTQLWVVSPAWSRLNTAILLDAGDAVLRAGVASELGAPDEIRDVGALTRDTTMLVMRATLPPESRMRDGAFRTSIATATTRAAGNQPVLWPTSVGRTDSPAQLHRRPRRAHGAARRPPHKPPGCEPRPPVPAATRGSAGRAIDSITGQRPALSLIERLTVILGLPFSRVGGGRCAACRSVVALGGASDNHLPAGRLIPVVDLARHGDGAVAGRRYGRPQRDVVAVVERPDGNKAAGVVLEPGFAVRPVVASGQPGRVQLDLPSARCPGQGDVAGRARSQRGAVQRRVPDGRTAAMTGEDRDPHGHDCRGGNAEDRVPKRVRPAPGCRGGSPTRGLPLIPSRPRRSARR
jgi:hypothetical protein